MSSDNLKYLFRFDANGKEPTPLNIILWAAIIFIGTSLVFIVLLGILGINANQSTDNEQNKEFQQLKEKGITPMSLFISSLIGAVIFAPIAEELTFRFLLLKVALVNGLKLPFIVANLIQAVLFGAIHVTNVTTTDQTLKYSILQASSAAISAIFSGYGYKESNSLITPWLAHVFNNTAATVSEAFSYNKYYNTNQNDSSTLPNMMARIKMKHLQRYRKI